MCGRYYFDSETEDVIRRVSGADTDLARFHGDICPSMDAVVLTGTDRLHLEVMKWGMPFDSGKLIINARAESALQKRMFYDGVMHRRCVIPASGFYEWYTDGSRATITRDGGGPLFMAGFYGFYNMLDCFVILTTAANAAMAPVHERMPLMIKEDALEEWLWDNSRLETFLKSQPDPVHVYREYDQLKFDFS